MLTNTEAADLPIEVAQQRTIASLGLSIGQYMKTLQGKQMVESQERFVLNGKVWNGYNQRAVESTEDQLTDSEIEALHDIDGTKHKLLATRARRLEGAALAKKRELAQRRKAEISAERDALELKKLQREEAKLQPDEPEPDTDPDPDPIEHVCATCGKIFEKANQLNAHKMGSKH